MTRALVLVATMILAGCGDDERSAPPASVLGLPDSVRVVGEDHTCDDACVRSLLVTSAPGSELETHRAVQDAVVEALARRGWQHNRAPTTVATHPDSGAVILVQRPSPLEPELSWTSRELTVKSEDLLTRGEPVVGITMLDRASTD